MRRFLSRAAGYVVVVAAALGVSGGTVFAHVEIVRTVPADGSVLTESPTHITLAFTDDLALDLAGVDLRTASGTEISLGSLAFGSDHRQLVRSRRPASRGAGRFWVLAPEKIGAGGSGSKPICRRASARISSPNCVA